MIIATASGRCGLLGNPTDMYGGSVISCSTRERAKTTLDGETDVMTLTVGGNTEVVRTIADLTLQEGDPLNIARAALIALEIDPATAPPFALTASTEIPMQAGLAGSTAILATVVGAVLCQLQIPLNQYEIAEIVRKIEYDVLKIVCGFQDSYMAVFGGLNYMDFRGKTSSVSDDPAAPYATIEPLHPFCSELPIMLAHTGIKHHSGKVHGSIRDRWLAGEQLVIDGYEEIARMPAVGKKAYLNGDWETLADLMTRNHAIQRDLGGSGDANEALIAAALAGGALGAKLAGAGGGGTILALTFDPEKTEKALLDAGAEKILHPAPGPGLTVEVRM
jgi:galactokinase/mevalonate kinase-like predicted kinase